MVIKQVNGSFKMYFAHVKKPMERTNILNTNVGLDAQPLRTMNTKIFYILLSCARMENERQPIAFTFSSFNIELNFNQSSRTQTKFRIARALHHLIIQLKLIQII